MAFILHAVVTISGPPDHFPSCAQRLERLLEGESLDGTIERLSTEGNLAYDLKIHGGLPFPVFIDLSNEYPELGISIDWVNSESGTRGSAHFSGGKLFNQDTVPLSPSIPGNNRFHIHVSADPQSRLMLAMVFCPAEKDKYLGYVVTSERDAWFRILRPGNGPLVELVTTAGEEASWCERWRIDLGDESFEFALFEPVLVIDSADQETLEALSQSFAQRWIWFASHPPEEIIVEAQSYDRRGHAPGKANLRTVRLWEMERKSGDNPCPLIFEDIDQDLIWIREIIEQCWAVAR